MKNKEIISLKNEIDQHRDFVCELNRLRLFYKSKNLIEKIDIIVPLISFHDEMINILQEKIKALQAICEHDWRWNGVSRNLDGSQYLVCRKCNANQKITLE